MAHSYKTLINKDPGVIRTKEFKQALMAKSGFYQSYFT